SVLYVTKSLAAAPHVLLDPNTLSKDGTVALGGLGVSHGGKKLAYRLPLARSDRHGRKVRDVAAGQDLPDLIQWTKFTGAAWTPDDKGFFYSRFAEPKPGETLQGQNFYQKLYYHKLGTPQAEDMLIYERPDQKEWNIGGGLTEDGRFLILS